LDFKRFMDRGSCMSRVTQAEFARLEGVNRSTVNRWVKDGRIPVGPDGLIDPVAGRQARLAHESLLPHHQARKASFEMEREASSAMAAAVAGVAGGVAGVFEPLDGVVEVQMPRLAGVADAMMPNEGLESSDVQRRYKLAAAREREAKAELAAMDVDKAAGLLVERAEVDFVLSDFGNTLRAMLESLPDRLSGDLAALQGDSSAIHKALADAMREILGSLAEQMKRRTQGLGQ
jgi:phage terminase Nu1 subunit (DNA packaging protein)